MVGWVSHYYYSVDVFFLFFTGTVFSVVYRLTYEINSMLMYKCKCYCFYWKYIYYVYVCSHTYSHSLYNMINMKLKSKCSQMFVRAFAAYTCTRACVCGVSVYYIRCVCVLRTQMCFGIPYVCNYQIKNAFRFIFFSWAKKLHLRIMLS